VLQPYDSLVMIGAAAGKDSEESLFQLPRTDSFLRAFARMVFGADQTLRDLLTGLERLGRQPKAPAG